MKKIPFAKNTWFDWCNLLLINCIPDPPIKTMGGVKDKIISLFKTNATKNHSKPDSNHGNHSKLMYLQMIWTNLEKKKG